MGTEERDNKEGSENGGGAADGVAEAGSAHAHVGGEEFRNVNGKEQSDENVDGNHKKKPGQGKEQRVANIRVDSPKNDGCKRSADDGGLTANEIGGE